MATQINNTASVEYAYGRSGFDSATSNVATTSLIEDYAISATKQSLNSSFRPGENITYAVAVRNDGTEPLYSVTISDDLGGANSPLSFVEGTGYVVVQGTSSQIVPTTLNPLTFTLSGVLPAGETANIFFVARVNSALAEDITSITNTVSVNAREGSATGTIISVSPSPTVTLPLEDYALLTITKEVSEPEIVPNQVFDYVITIENSGSLDATNVVVTDTLPEGFVINSIVSVTNGVTTTYTSANYTLDPSTNTLTLPTGGGVSLVVPASSGGVAGVTTITINGQIN